MTEYEKRILAALERLPEDLQGQLVDYAEFLVGRAGSESSPGQAEPESPQPVEKAEDEGPIQAIKRLRATYPMLDRRYLLDETSQVMTKRYLRGKAEEEVIQEIEEVFERHYQRYLERFEPD